ncbi:kinase-like domain-containing protein [Annulohypoxylon truncatum]|uniref:kinase-like domain-containing protein n=1 Tax=Annulohypoxylon truncatum TaxID=327061 RepID=UPI0020076CD6|nr:kinase-like domain-containing protein [Annulohypoxylon truncatum]KAI1204806.1 kinase-like domain-containing protein [Annulohypoxylon truncatum]
MHPLWPYLPPTSSRSEIPRRDVLSPANVAPARSPLPESMTLLQEFQQDIAHAKRMAPPRSTAGLYRIACSVELLFLIDTTGSMKPYIDAARKQVRDIVAEAQKAFLEEALLRVAVVGYKDHADIPNIQFLDFTPDTVRVKQFLDTLVAATGGGGDSAEDVLGGIRQATNASWSQEARCIVHIADAPPHGRNLHDMTGSGRDCYIEPGSEPHRLTYEPLLNQLVRLNINYALLRISRDTDRMASAFSTVYKTAHAEVQLHQSNRYYGDFQAGKAFGSRAYVKNSVAAVLQFEELELGTTFHSLKHLVGKSISSSVSRTVGRLSSYGNVTTGKRTKPPARLTVVGEEEIPMMVPVENLSPQWDNHGWFDKRLVVEGLCPDLVMHSAATFYDMMTQDDQMGLSPIQLVIEARSKPFSQGAMRTAAYARIPSSTGRFVVKSFKKQGAQIANLAEHMQCQAMCKAFAIEFNALLGGLYREYSIDFIITAALTSKSSTGVRQEYISLEPYINGTYVKYNGNQGYVNDNNFDPSNQAAQAFSHFTFERSQGQLLVNDLQGVGNLLTDPAIQTKDRNRFKLCGTNLNEEGFKFFMATHNCNHLCHLLRLRSNKAMLKEGGILQFRTYWPNVESMNYCSNKLCRRILHNAADNKSAIYPGYWCDSCKPQLYSTIEKRICLELGQTHRHDLSKFFHESQGEALPSKCPLHPNADLIEPRPIGFGFPLGFYL